MKFFAFCLSSFCLYFAPSACAVAESVYSGSQETGYHQADPPRQESFSPAIAKDRAFASRFSQWLPPAALSPKEIRLRATEGSALEAALAFPVPGAEDLYFRTGPPSPPFA